MATVTEQWAYYDPHQEARVQDESCSRSQEDVSFYDSSCRQVDDEDGLEVELQEGLLAGHA